MADKKIYDVVILGGGAAGLTAGIYASRARLSTILIEKAYPGGQIMMCENIENYPGFPEGTNGMNLSTALREQAEKFGIETLLTDIERLDLLGYDKAIFTTSGEEIHGKSVILALGARPKFLGAPGEAEFLGRGVSYCAVCDGAFFKDKKIVVVGGGDTAIEDSIFLTRYSSEVHIIHRRDKFRAQKIIQERALSNEFITVHWNSVVKEIAGDDMVKHVIIEDVNTKSQSKLETDAVFVLIGHSPNTVILEEQVKLDELGYITTDVNMATNIPGVFAAGDVRDKLLRQIVTACADGAIAATAAEKYIEG